MMMQLKVVLFVNLLALVLPLNTYAAKVKIVGGGFEFLHAPVNPDEPDGFCVDPPGAQFNVESDQFDGLIITDEIAPFTGSGNATGCAFMEPVFGVAARFTGSFTWQAFDGEIQGTFLLLDFPTEFPGVFEAVVFITFDGGTGRYKKARGYAIALGTDLPFGGLGEDGSGAGVVGEFIGGRIRVKNTKR